MTGTTLKSKELKLLLKALPTNLPMANHESRLNRLLNFTLDDEKVEDIGTEGAINRELEAALFDFLPRNDASTEVHSSDKKTLIHRKLANFLYFAWLICANYCTN